MITAAPALAAPTTAAATQIRFKLCRNYLVMVEGALAGRPATFLLDTGASPSVIDAAIARDLGIHGQPGAVALVNGAVRDEIATLSELRLGPVRKESFPVLIRDLGFIQKELGIHVDAVVGLDVLGGTSFAIDYRTQRLLFGPVTPANHKVAFRPEAPFLGVNVAVRNRVLHLLLDTGTPGFTLFRQRVKGVETVAVNGKVAARNMAGSLSLSRVALPDVTIGGVRLGTQTASLIEDTTGAGGSFDGIMGPAALQVRRITFDYERQEFGWDR